MISFFFFNVLFSRETKYFIDKLWRVSLQMSGLMSDCFSTLTPSAPLVTLICYLSAVISKRFTLSDKIKYSFINVSNMFLLIDFKVDIKLKWTLWYVYIFFYFFHFCSTASLLTNKLSCIHNSYIYVLYYVGLVLTVYCLM